MALSRPVPRRDPRAVSLRIALTGACGLAVLIFDPRHTMRERLY